MVTTKERLHIHFSEEKLVDEVVKMLASSETDSLTKEVIAEILAGTSPLELLKKLYLASRSEDPGDTFPINIPLSNCFILVSRLATINVAERKFALDMSVFLSECNDGRDPSFRAVDLFGYIH